MKTMPNPPHSFHIPVMGTGFTIDTPLRVARYGISSVMSLVDDVLIEKVREHYCRKLGEPFEPIAAAEEDARARRITAYLNLVDRQVHRQVRELQESAFENGDIRRYFEMLPDSPLKQSYQDMLAAADPAEKTRIQQMLRPKAVPGSIDVNIMTKLDRDAYQGGKKQAPEASDALSALRGFAGSTLRSAIVFSAGFNQRLYSYAARFADFFPDETGGFKKKIILKVSDYRSAEIQGKFLAKKGLWVSEYRVESGLNCGGHAFATQGHLLGPVLEEFKRKRRELTEILHEIYIKAHRAMGRTATDQPAEVRLTVQGGIGTALENDFLLKYYQVDGTGWGTPFLLAPEATQVDPVHLERMRTAGEGDVYLSECSPLGVPFWNLRSSGSEEARRRRIKEDKPGSPCPKGFAALNTEFTETPICPASRSFVKRKLESLREKSLPIEAMFRARERVLEKSCLCHDLAGGAALNLNLDPTATPAICCGPNIVHFSKIATLEEMVGHIYGRLSLLATGDRPHMFITELRLYIEQLHGEIRNLSQELTKRPQGYFQTFKENLLTGIDYYRGLARQYLEDQRDRFLEELRSLQEELQRVSLPAAS